MRKLDKYKASVLFGTMYMLVIVLFAIIYTLLSNDFYNTALQHENSISRENKEIRMELENSIKERYKELNQSDVIIDNKWRLAFDKFKVESMILENQFFTFGLRMHYDNLDSESNPPSISNVGWLKISTDFFPTDVEKPMMESELIIILDENDFGSDDLVLNGEELSKIFNLYPQASFAQVEIPWSIQVRLKGYIDSVQGFPRKIDGGFLRMLYLSMVTITTLGYGDIRPLTNLTRMLVGAEAVIGILLIGWFAHSIINELKNSK